MAENLFQYFRSSPLFRWKDEHNDCEDRANAICILLDQWEIPNYKAWVFGGSFLNKESGNLVSCWNYHVAVAIPVQLDEIVYCVIDPATSSGLQSIEAWALNVTEWGTSYHLIKHGRYYIFPSGKIERDNWFVRCPRNLKWTMQGLAGINGVSKIGKAQLVFNKPKIKRVERAFKNLLYQQPLMEAGYILAEK